MTRPCECGLGLRPRRLFGLQVEPVDGAPCCFTSSITLGGCRLPSTDSLSGFVSTDNGKIQGGTHAIIAGRATALPARVSELGSAVDALVGPVPGLERVPEHAPSGRPAPGAQAQAEFGQLLIHDAALERNQVPPRRAAQGRFTCLA